MGALASAHGQLTKLEVRELLPLAPCKKTVQFIRVVLLWDWEKLGIAIERTCNRCGLQYNLQDLRRKYNEL